MVRFLVWIAVGLIAGWFASTRWGGKGNKALPLALGVVGAIVGGWLIPSLSSKGATLGASLVASFVGAGVALLIWRFYEIRREAA